MQICSASSSNDEAQDRNASDRDRILRSRSAVSTIDDEHFQGTAPMAAEYPDHDSLCGLADGYSWLRCFPQSPHHIMTFMFDADRHVLQLC